MAGIDFSRMGRGPSDNVKLVHPRDVFAALPGRASGFEYLRGPQDQVLDQWFQRRAERDIVIKMNTGGGKTVVGLLLAQCSINDGVGPVAYLVPDRYLVEQVRREAGLLGIAVTDDPRSFAYSNGQAVLVDTFQRLFNGLSIFGVSGSVPKAAQVGLGTIIIDDAHACLARAEEEVFRLVLGSGTSAYKEILARFTDVLEQQTPNGLLDLKAGRRSALLQIPHWAWAERQSDVLRALHPFTDQQPHKFTWPLLADILPICRAVFTSDALEIAPSCLPVGSLIGFSGAKRRIYLTATLADDGVLITDFDADPKAVESPIVPANAGDIGDRLILMPHQTHPDASEGDVRDLLVSLAAERNVVVIVPSKARSEFWRPHAAIVLDKDTLEVGISALRRNPSLGLVVLINRYDGVDLPGDACHVLVIDGLPEALDGLDRLDEAQLTGSAALLRRQIQRIEQGMGRAVRSNDDHCVVVLTGSRLTERLHRPGAMASFSPATRTQLDLSSQVAHELVGSGLDNLDAVIRQVLGRDPNWVAESRARLAPLRYEPARVGDDTVARRRAFDKAAAGSYGAAVELLQPALDAVAGDPLRRGQLLQELATYQQQIDPVLAQATQRAANEANRSMLRPVVGPDYSKLATPTQEQGAAAAIWLQARYSTAAELKIGFNALVADLVFGPRTEAFERAFDELAWHIGLAGQRPEREIGRGPDSLWALPGGKFIVIEAKSGASEHPVFKDDAKQLSNAMDWFRAQYPGGSGTPVLVHRWASFDKKAAIPTGCRVITSESLEKLREAVVRLGAALAEKDMFRDAKKVAVLLASQGLVGAEFLARFSVAARQAS